MYLNKTSAAIVLLAAAIFYHGSLGTYQADDFRRVLGLSFGLAVTLGLVGWSLWNLVIRTSNRKGTGE